MNQKKWKRKSYKSRGDVKCPKCGRGFSSENAMKLHFESMHTLEGQFKRRSQMIENFMKNEVRK